MWRCHLAAPLPNQRGQETPRKLTALFDDTSAIWQSGNKLLPHKNCKQSRTDWIYLPHVPVPACCNLRFRSFKSCGALETWMCCFDPLPSSVPPPNSSEKGSKRPIGPLVAGRLPPNCLWNRKSEEFILLVIQRLGGDRNQEYQEI